MAGLKVFFFNSYSSSASLRHLRHFNDFSSISQNENDNGNVPIIFENINEFLEIERMNQNLPFPGEFPRCKSSNLIAAVHDYIFHALQFDY